MNPAHRILVALDTPDIDRALFLARELKDIVGGMKIGIEFFTANGPAGYARIAELGMPVFLDLKFCDIPNTVAAAVAATLPLKPFMVNVHAFGGPEMMRAAVAAAAQAGNQRPLMLAVTVLTSLTTSDLLTIGIPSRIPEEAARLALLAKNCGLDGAVCASAELMTIRGACGPNFRLVVPGIRPSWASEDDHRRTLTPADAVALGADFLVIGRPITGSADPVGAARRISNEIAQFANGS